MSCILHTVARAFMTAVAAAHSLEQMYNYPTNFFLPSAQAQISSHMRPDAPLLMYDDGSLWVVLPFGTL